MPRPLAYRLYRGAVLDRNVAGTPAAGIVVVVVGGAKTGVAPPPPLSRDKPSHSATGVVVRRLGFFFLPMDPSTFAAPNGRLTKAQGDALVYSTLCGFMLVGLWAGINTRSKREFISGVRTQPGTWAVGTC